MNLSRIALIAALAAPVAASAQDLSAEIGQAGIAPTIARLESLEAPTDADRFALGGLRFLGAVEAALQRRWQAGLTESLQIVPFLRLPLEENPAPGPFDPALIATLFRDVSDRMTAARAPLAEIAATSDFAVDIALADLWFDVNGNATRDMGEDMLDIAGPMILGWRWQERDPAAPAPVIRFDVADAAWLSAYTHLLAGISDVILTYDPTASLTRMTEARAAMDALRAAPPDPFSIDAQFGVMVDIAYGMIDALAQEPDKDRAASAQAHFLAMVADNREFWARVATETDNDREWLPNDAQQSALGLVVPPGTGAVWQVVLADLEAVLKGELLIPYWRLDSGAGVNVGRLFTDPRPVDLVGWVQGAAALPYLEKGRLATSESLAAFDGLVQGEAMLFSLFLN